MKTRSPWLAGEPDLSDLLDDPVTRAIMGRDGVDRDELIESIRRARLAIRWRRQGRPDIMDNAA